MQFIRPPTDRLNNSHTKLLLRGDAIADASPNARALTNNGAVASATAPAGHPYATKALSFNAASYLSVQSADFAAGTNDFTFSGWFYSNALTANQGIFHLSTSFLPSSHAGIALSYYGPGSIWQLNCDGSQFTYSTAQYAAWLHWAVVKYNGYIKVYLNGVCVIIVATSYNVTHQYLVVGSFYNTNYRANGYMVGFKYDTKAALWTKNFTPPTRGV